MTEKNKSSGREEGSEKRVVWGLEERMNERKRQVQSLEQASSREDSFMLITDLCLSFERKMSRTWLVLLLAGGCFAFSDINYLERILQGSLEEMNSELLELNTRTTLLSWKLSVDPEGTSFPELTKLGEIHKNWRQKWCALLGEIFQKIYQTVEWDVTLPRNYSLEYRQFYLLCRGPIYDSEQNKELISVLGKLENIYQTSLVCLDDGTCFRGEPDLERIMTKSRDPSVLFWAWTEWRNKVGPSSRVLYPSLVGLLNEGAKNGGYKEIGECWREELEAEDLEKVVEELYVQLEPLYVALHAVVRYRLHQYYGPDLVSLYEPIPAHLLGNMWAQDWGSLLDIVVDVKANSSFTYYLNKKNYTVIDLVKKAEDFYVSLGFKPMSEAFWKNSKFVTDSKNGSNCHGTAADMFQPHDYRIVLCAQVTEEDFYVIHHELGHIQYYIEYENQTTIFRDGVNSAFQEAIGDAIMYGVISPAHLHRIGFINEIDQNSEADLKLLLHKALMKIPQIPFALMLEKWRWDVFKGKISPLDYNKAWWELTERYQGIKPPIRRSEQHFDPSAKFHVNDNRPYIRYYLASILQMQIFESLCKASIFGEDYKGQKLPLPLHKCDIYGSATATKNLRKMMSMGSSIHWKEALKLLTEEDSYSVRPLLDYYKPLFKWLKNEILVHNIPTGWNTAY